MKILDIKILGDKDKSVWLNGKEVSSHAWRAYVPTSPGVTGLGWVDRYRTDAQGRFIAAEEGGAISYRTYGLVRFQNLPDKLEPGAEA